MAGLPTGTAQVKTAVTMTLNQILVVVAVVGKAIAKRVVLGATRGAR